MNKPNGLTIIDYKNVHNILMGLDIGFSGGVSFKEKCMNIKFIMVKFV